MKTILSRIVTGAMVLAIAVFGLKGCIVTTWLSPAEPTTYAIRGSDGRALSMTFLPKNETLITYAERDSGFLELSLTKMRGVYGTHYFGRVWRLEGPAVGAGLFGLRVYPEGSQPVVMETTVLKKFVHGTSKQTLPVEGEVTHPIILFSEKQVGFSGMTLDKELTDGKALEIALQTLRLPK